jgi:hypothetical protein
MPFFLCRLAFAENVLISSHIQIGNEYAVRANFAKPFSGVQGIELILILNIHNLFNRLLRCLQFP